MQLERCNMNMNVTSWQPREMRRSEPPTLSTQELDRDPHALFRRMRLMTPFIRREDGCYLAIRSGDVERLCSDTRTRQAETERSEAQGITSGYLYDFLEHAMLFSNGGAHRQRRLPLSRAFAFRLIAELRPRIRAVAHKLIDAVEARGEMEFVDEFASLLPAQIICEILGLPEADIPQFTRWVYSISRVLSPSFERSELADMEAAAQQMTEYINVLLADRRATPRMDFLSSYVLGVDEAGKLTPVEVVSQIMAVIVGGGDSTRGALAIQMFLLLQHREQWEAACRGDSNVIAGAVSEALRYEPAVASTLRFTLEDIEIAGYVVPAGSLLSLSTLSAMRDPALYTEPDRFNIRRTDHPRRHLVFGGGAHRCLGEVLARAELEESLAALAERLPKLQLSGEPFTVYGHAGVRRISPLRLSWPQSIRP
jgi:cytochrome P450 family 103